MRNAHKLYPVLIRICNHPQLSVAAGMFQRLDKLRKNAFASVILFGKDNSSSISGIWIVRGHKLPFTVSAHSNVGALERPPVIGQDGVQSWRHVLI